MCIRKVQEAGPTKFGPTSGPRGAPLAPCARTPAFCSLAFPPSPKTMQAIFMKSFNQVNFLALLRFFAFEE